MGTEGEDARVIAGRYRLDARLGRGGMGIVWQATDQLLGRRVAVKEIALDETLSAEQARAQRDRTLREARAVAQLRHPNIVVVHDVVDDGRRPYLVMELVDGGTLADRIARGGPVDAAEAARIGVALLGALSAAHAAGVLHRDLKPANVLIESGTDRVVLTDFGIAQVAGATTLTETGSFVGSPEYTAPERMSGTATGPASDLWSLGALLCTILSGESPFRRDSLGGILHAVVVDEIRTPEQAAPLLPVVRGLLERDPERRLDATQAERLLRAFRDTGSLPDPGADAGTGAAVDAGAGAGFGPGAVPGAGFGPGAVGAGAGPGYVPGADAGFTPGSVPGAGTGSSPPGWGSVPGAVSGRTPDPARDATGQAVAGYTPTQAGLPRSGAPAGQGRAPERSTRGTLVAAFLVAAMAGAGVSAAALLMQGGDDGGAPGAPGRASSPATAPAATVTVTRSPGPAPTSAGPVGTGTGSSATGSQAGDGARPVAPSGYRIADDPAGFRLAVPDGFVRRPQGERVFYLSPDDSFRLGVKVSDPEPGGPLAVMRRQAAQGADTNPGYHSGTVTETTHGGRPAALWEFTWNGFTAAEGARHSYDLCWEEGGRLYDVWVSAPVGKVREAREYFDVAVDTFTRS
ncbi:serine/threonine-protein kinase [Streptomyces sp. NPDC028635]|uniref:serine/threonine-protein kinase n=1 Tax=Streptomyces sp. NPDC028635 TaxID=3154800 RepID=UPI0033E9A23F